MMKVAVYDSIDYEENKAQQGFTGNAQRELGRNSFPLGRMTGTRQTSYSLPTNLLSQHTPSIRLDDQILHHEHRC